MSLFGTSRLDAPQTSRLGVVAEIVQRVVATIGNIGTGAGIVIVFAGLYVLWGDRFASWIDAEQARAQAIADYYNARTNGEGAPLGTTNVTVNTGGTTAGG